MAAYHGGIAYGALGNHTAAFLAAGILAILAALINREPLQRFRMGSAPRVRPFPPRGGTYLTPR